MYIEENNSAIRDRELALERANQLKSRINDFLDAAHYIRSGFLAVPETNQNREKILKVLSGTPEDWANWQWQMANRIKDADVLAQIIPLTDKEIAEIKKVGTRFRWAISPYYASLINSKDKGDPVGKQSIPSILECSCQYGVDDPMGEQYTSPAPAITRRYPDRLIINVTNQCGMYCRHCQRRRNIGEIDRHTSKINIEMALQYIRENTEIRDVLITGGDALLLSDEFLDWILTELDNIPHVEIKRIGTRTIVTMPQRITNDLCSVLAKHPPLFINTQFNHPQEVTPEAAKACDMLIKAGAVLGNQAVLLRGINNNPHIMKKLNHELLKIRVRPYYIFQAKTVTGTGHFIAKIEEGLDIMEHLRGYTSGLAVPTYIVNAPDGYGKTPLVPDYILSQGEDSITIRTWENRIINYPDKTINQSKKLNKF